jgi:S1-C subfamily serine protease
VKHAVIGFSSVTLPLALLLVGVVAAQSAPPRKDIPAIAKAANDRGQAPVKISDAFAKAEVLALQAIEIEKADSTLVTRPDGSFVTRSETALDVAKSEAVSSQEKLISSLVERIYEYKVVSDYPSEVLEKSPTLEQDVKGFSSRINACISAEKDALRRRSAEVPKACNDEVISPPKTKEEMSALQRKINAEVQTAERGADTVAANGPERQPGSQSAPPRKDIPAIAKAANGAIVSIIMSDKDGHAIAQGSGFLISNDGMILTNYHVIAEGSSAVVKLPDRTIYVVDGVLASDKVRDVAVIKAHGNNFRTLALGNSDQLQVGEEVVAIGNPLSLESTVSNGIVSGIRTVEEEGGKFLQVTTPISAGSSGGPLFNMAGEVVGITTMYLKGGENLNFAIPINDAKRQLLDKSTIVHALPNETEPIQAQTPDAAKALNWIASHMLRKALHTMPGGSGSTMQLWETSTLSFQECRVTIYDETTIFTIFKSGEKYGGGTSVITWGPFDLSNLRPDEIFLAPDKIFQPPGAFLQIEAINAVPIVQTDGSGSTTSSARSALHIWFDSADSVDRQVKAWHDAIVGCGGKPIPDVY